MIIRPLLKSDNLTISHALEFTKAVMTTSDEEWDAEFPLFPGARRHLSNAIQYMAFRHKVEVDLSVIRSFFVTEGNNPSINCFLGSFLLKTTGGVG